MTRVFQVGTPNKTTWVRHGWQLIPNRAGKQASTKALKEWPFASTVHLASTLSTATSRGVQIVRRVRLPTPPVKAIAPTVRRASMQI